MAECHKCKISKGPLARVKLSPQVVAVLSSALEVNVPPVVSVCPDCCPEFSDQLEMQQELIALQQLHQHLHGHGKQPPGYLDYGAGTN